MICPKCGNEAGDGKFCQSCGAPVADVQPTAAEPTVTALPKNMIACKSCGTPMAKNAKTCPKCGAKNKKPIYKRWWLWALIAVVLIIIFASAGSGDDEKTPAQSNGTTVAAQEKTAKEAQTAKTTEAAKTYEKHDVTDLFKALEGNAINAKNQFENKDVELTGYISNIDASGDYIGLGANPDDYEYMFDSVQCYIKSDEQLNKITQRSKGDRITIRGTITSVGEVMGYSMNIDSIV